MGGHPSFDPEVNQTRRERRRFLRLPIAIQIELRPEGNVVPIRVETSDISAGGCYVQMSVTLEVGAMVNVVLWLGDEKLTFGGRVVTRHPHFGNGIAFSDLADEPRRRLELFINRAASIRNLRESCERWSSDSFEAR